MINQLIYYKIILNINYFKLFFKKIIYIICARSGPPKTRIFCNWARIFGLPGIVDHNKFMPYQHDPKTLHRSKLQTLHHIAWCNNKFMLYQYSLKTLDRPNCRLYITRLPDFVNVQCTFSSYSFPAAPGSPVAPVNLSIHWMIWFHIYIYMYMYMILFLIRAF